MCLAARLGDVTRDHLKLGPVGMADCSLLRDVCLVCQDVSACRGSDGVAGLSTAVSCAPVPVV
jgi:hypothetical protein